MKYILIFIISFTIINSCGNNANEFPSDDPKKLAKISFDIANIGGDQEKLTKYFNKYNLNLTSGMDKYHSDLNKILSDKKNEKIYKEESFMLLLKEVMGKDYTNIKSDKKEN